VIYVTHDLDDALYLGDRVAVIIEGRLRQHGLADEVFTAPQDSQIAAFVGVETVISAEVVNCQDGEITVRSGDVQIEALGELAQGQKVIVCLRPEDVTLWVNHDLPMTSARNLIEGTVNRIQSQGPLMKIIVDCPHNGENLKFGSSEIGPVQIVSLITRNSFRELEISIGKKVAVTFKATAVHLVTK
jgi:ABC-type Fe3+/spermidine/putrescine transport system ATPase subunit